MNKKIAKSLWIIIVFLFVCLQIYHLIVGNYYDMLFSLSLIIIMLLVLGIYYLIRKKRKIDEINKK